MNKKFSKFTIWHYILIITISTLLFVGVMLFLYQYILGVSESNNSDVLQATSFLTAGNTTEFVRTINRYRIESLEGGSYKSIRPKDCYGFDDVEYGVTSWMNRICRRNFFANDDFKDKIYGITNFFGGTIKPGLDIDEKYKDPSRPNDRIVPPSLDLTKTQTGLTGRYNPGSYYEKLTSSPFSFEWLQGETIKQFYLGNEGPLRLTHIDNDSEEWFRSLIRHPFPTSIQTHAGVKMSFKYYGGEIWHTNMSLKDTYIFREEKVDNYRNSVKTPAHLTAVKDIPIMIYYGGVYGVDRNKGNKDEVYLITRLWDSDSYYTKTCKTFKTPKVVYRIERYNQTFIYFRNVVDDLNDVSGKCFANGSFKDQNVWTKCRDLGLNLTTPEIFKDTLTQQPNGKRNQAWSSDMRCKDFSQGSVSYQDPELNEIVLTKNPSSDRVSLVSKRSILVGAQSGGFAFGERITCLGISENDKCVDIIEIVGRSDSSLTARSVTTGTNNYSFNNQFGSFISSYRCNQWSSCTKMPIITDTKRVDSKDVSRVHPFTNESGGYELPKRWYDYGIRAFELDSLNRRYVSFDDPYAKSGRADINVKSGSVPTKIDYSFSDENSLYGIELKPNNFVLYQINMPKKDEIHITSKASANVNTNIRKSQNISTTFVKTYDYNNRITILFSDKSEQGSNLYQMFEAYVNSPKDCPSNSDGTPNPCSEIFQVKEVFLSDPPPLPILQLKYYPRGNTNEFDYVYLTKEKVYYSKALDVFLPPPPICQAPLTSTASITNTSPNSNLTNTWPLSYNETAARRLVVNIGATANTPITCNGQRITAASISVSPVNSPSSIFTFQATGNSSTSQGNTLTFIAPSNLPNIPSNMDYQIRSLTLTAGNQTITLTPLTHPNLFGARGWDFYTENIVKVRIQNSPQPFPLTVSVDKYRINSPTAIRKFSNILVSNVFDSFSNNIPGFFYDGEYTSSLDNFYYDLCFQSNISISSFSSNNSNIQLSLNGPSCLRFRSKSSSRGIFQEVVINLANSSSAIPAKEVWNGNVYHANPSGLSLLQKPSANASFAGILFSNSNISNPWQRYLRETKFSSSIFRESQTSLQGFLASSSLNLGVNGSEFYLLVNPSSNVTEGTGNAFPLANYVTLSNPNASTKDFHVIAVSKGRGISFDLTNSFLLNQKIDNFAFVNLSGKLPERIRFYANCENSNYSYICGNQNRYVFKAPIFGSYIIDFKNAPANSGSNLVITENPDILMKMIPTIRSKKMNIVTSTPINITYLD